VFYNWKTAVDHVIVETQNETNTAILDTIENFINAPPYINIDGAINFAERFRQTIAEKEFRYQEIHLCITMTFGVAVYNKGMDIDEVIKNADIAVYQGKDGGRNRVEQFKA